MVKGTEVDRPARSWGWLFPVLWAGLVLVSSSIPHISTPGGFFARDKLIHMAEYAVLGTLVAVGLAERVSWGSRARALVTLGVCVLFGALDEVYQHSVGGRAADVLDFASDGVGAALSQVLMLTSRRGAR